MSVDIHKGDRIVSRSRNLRGLMTYARKHGIHRIDGHYVSHHQAEHDGNGFLLVRFKDGATLQTEFADFQVLRTFMWNRRNLWNLQQHGCSNPARNILYTTKDKGE